MKKFKQLLKQLFTVECKQTTETPAITGMSLMGL